MKLLVTVRWDSTRLAEVRDAFPQVEFVEAFDEETQVREVADAEVVFGHLDRAPFLAAKKLKWIQCHGAGVDFITHVPELPASDVILTNTRGAHAKTIAEHTIGMLIALSRGFHDLFRAQDRREWLRPFSRPAVGLSGRTLGIVGLGNIGRAIAQRAAAMEMRVIAVDVAPGAKPDCVESLGTLDGLPSLLRQSDAVVVAAPYTAETAGMIGSAEIASMRPTAFLLVISRGGILDERALIAALKEGRLAGAGLDVQSREPLPADDPLWDAPNLFLTPHCSGQSTQTTAAATAIFKENLGRYISGMPLVNVVDKARGF